MKDYNLELQKLIVEAKNRGFIYQDGQFVPSLDTKHFINCLDVHYISAGNDEENGDYRMFSKSYLIDDKQKDDLISLAEKTQLDKDYEAFISSITQIMNKNGDKGYAVISDNMFSDFSENGCWINETFKTDEEDSYFIVYSNYYNEQISISVSHIPLETFNDLENIDVHKCFRWQLP